MKNLIWGFSLAAGILIANYAEATNTFWKCRGRKSSLMGSGRWGSLQLKEASVVMEGKRIFFNRIASDTSNIQQLESDKFRLIFIPQKDFKNWGRPAEAIALIFDKAAPLALDTMSCSGT